MTDRERPIEDVPWYEIDLMEPIPVGVLIWSILAGTAIGTLLSFVL